MSAERILVRILNAPGIRAGVRGVLLALTSLIPLAHPLRSRIIAVTRRQSVEVGARVSLSIAALKLFGRTPSSSVLSWFNGSDERTALRDMCEKAVDKVPDPGLQRAILLLSEVRPDDPRLTEYVDMRLRQYLQPRKAPEVKSYLHFNNTDASQALRDLDVVFKGLSVPMFLVSGTFLGAYREGRFLDTDYDIDVGYLASDIEIPRVEEALLGSPAFPRVKASETKLRTRHKNGVTIDVFTHFEDEGLVWHGSALHRWYNTPFDLTTYSFDGGEYLGPADAERYLTENYGNWRSPVAFWDYSFDTPNQVFPDTAEAVLHLMDYVVTHPDRHRAQAALLVLRDRFDIDLTEFIPSGGSDDLTHRLEQLGISNTHSKLADKSSSLER